MGSVRAVSTSVLQAEVAEEVSADWAEVAVQQAEAVHSRVRVLEHLGKETLVGQADSLMEAEAGVRVLLGLREIPAQTRLAVLAVTEQQFPQLAGMPMPHPLPVEEEAAEEEERVEQPLQAELEGEEAVEALHLAEQPMGMAMTVPTSMALAGEAGTIVAARAVLD